MDTPLEKAVKIIIQLSDSDKIILFGSRAREDYKDALEIAEVVVSWIETKFKIAHIPRPEGE